MERSGERAGEREQENIKEENCGEKWGHNISSLEVIMKELEGNKRNLEEHEEHQGNKLEETFRKHKNKLFATIVPEALECRKFVFSTSSWTFRVNSVDFLSDRQKQPVAMA
ncbi:hypothetical protein Btru_022057 [Bulinus truncatus]|nr:hypothetical protein Btru_022057 [Bulinus truncatus]